MLILFEIVILCLMFTIAYVKVGGKNISNSPLVFSIRGVLFFILGTILLLIK
jgi:hypothetical protein